MSESKAISEFEKILTSFSKNKDVEVGQMFGKRCLKIAGKAFVAQHKDTVVFKVTANAHEKAIGLAGAKLWDPSGKARPMKEWVAIQPEHAEEFASLAKAAAKYVGSKEK